MPRKKADGFASIDLRQFVIVVWIGKPFEAFSMIALREEIEYEILAFAFTFYLMENTSRIRYFKFRGVFRSFIDISRVTF